MALLTGMDVVLKVATGSEVALTNEAMSVVLDEFPDGEDYTIYEISDPDKRYLSRSQVPVFQKYDNGEWVNISSSEIADIQYPGGRVVLDEPLSSSDMVRCASGKHLSEITPILGGTSAKLSLKNDLVDVTTFGDVARMRYPVISDWSATLDLLVLLDDGVPSQLSTLKDLVDETLIAVIYMKVEDDVRFEGYCRLESLDVNLNADDVVKQPITLQGDGPLYLRLK